MPLLIGKRGWRSLALALLLVVSVSACRSGGGRLQDNVDQDPHHHYQWAQEQFRRGYYLEALEAIDKAIAIDSSKYLYYNMRGLIFRSAGELGKAVAEFNKVLELNPYFTDAHNNLGATFAEQGETDQALLEFDKVLRDPMYQHKEKAHFNSGELHFSQGNYEKAIEHYQKAVTVRPDYLRAHFKLGKALQAVSRVTEARNAFAAVQKIAPQSDEAREVKLILDSLDASS